MERKDTRRAGNLGQIRRRLKNGSSTVRRMAPEVRAAHVARKRRGRPAR